MKKILLRILIGFLVLLVGLYIAGLIVIHNETAEYNEMISDSEKNIEEFLDNLAVLQEGGNLEFEEFYGDCISAGDSLSQLAHLFWTLKEKGRPLQSYDYSIMYDIHTLITQLYCNATKVYYFQEDTDSAALEKKIEEDTETVRNMMAELCVPYDM